jgi:hypothetical protein
MMRENGEMVRLYPVSFRYLDRSQQYSKWHIVELEISANDQDYRKESFRPNLDTLRVIGSPITTDSGWIERR